MSRCIAAVTATWPLPYPFDLAFMQRALVAGVAVGVFAPLIGTFLVQKRLSLIGDGIGHVAFAGVGAGLLVGIWSALDGARVRRRRRRSGVEWLRGRAARVGRPGARALLLRGHRARGGALALGERGRRPTC